MRDSSISAPKLVTLIFLIVCIPLTLPAEGIAQGGTWATKSPMPTPRRGMATAVVDGILYVAGGCTGLVDAPLDVMEAYDPKSDTWSTKSPMPSKRCDPDGGSISGLMYVVGGYDRVGQISYPRELATLEVYNPMTDSWSAKAPMPTPRAGLAVGVIDGILYAVAGQNDSGFLATVEAYNPKTDTWVAKAPMPTARVGLVGSVVDGLLHVTAGNGTSFLRTLEVYNPRNDSWTVRSELPTPRVAPAAGVIDGVIYVVGGSDGTHREVEAYDPKTNSWTMDTPMPTGRSGLAAGVVDDVLYALEGETLHSGAFSVNEAFSPFLAVGIDIKPGDATNTINLKSAGTVAVAILGSATFDPLTVDPATVTLAGAPVATRAQGAAMTAQGDLNHDGYLDLLLHFRTQDLKLTPADTEALLYGQTVFGQRIRGSDSVRIVPPGAGRSVGQASKELRGRGAFTRVQGPPVAR